MDTATIAKISALSSVSDRKWPINFLMRVHLILVRMWRRAISGPLRVKCTLKWAEEAGVAPRFAAKRKPAPRTARAIWFGQWA